ncbi:hypothetical protein GCM10025772_19300 [Ferrimonas gelatinilytica]|uniref:Uncharacterized protein n=1 Tax=Ferrimonas gelatinilytica TaxID=1255257 RepID=A0ABP9S5T4_9GAMM
MKILAALMVMLLLCLIGLVGWQDPWSVALNDKAWFWIAGPLALVSGALLFFGCGQLRREWRVNKAMLPPRHSPDPVREPRTGSGARSGEKD